MCGLSDEGEGGERREHEGEGGIVDVSSSTGIGLPYKRESEQ